MGPPSGPLPEPSARPIAVCHPAARRAGAALLAAFVLTGAAMAHPTVLFDVAGSPAELVFSPVDDRVMGGVSRSRMVRSAAGTLVFEGEVSLESGGGFASVRSAPLAASLAGASALRLTVRGDGKRYKLNLRTDAAPDGVQYQSAFTAPAGDWTDVSLPLAGFAPVFRGRPVPDAPPLAADAVRVLGFVIADRQAGPFKLEVKRIAAETDAPASGERPPRGDSR